MHVSREHNSQNATPPLQRCQLGQSRGLHSRNLARDRPSQAPSLCLALLSLPPTHILLQPDSNLKTVSVNASHVVANTHQPIMTRPAKDMRFLLGSHKHQHHHHDDA